MTKFVLVPFKEFNRLKAVEQELMHQDTEGDSVVQNGGGDTNVKSSEMSEDQTPPLDTKESGMSEKSIQKPGSDRPSNQYAAEHASSSFPPLPPPGLPYKREGYRIKRGGKLEK
jgi:hypothetical protein